MISLIQLILESFAHQCLISFALSRLWVHLGE